MIEAQCIKYPVKRGHRELLVNWIWSLPDRSGELEQAMAKED